MNLHPLIPQPSFLLLNLLLLCSFLLLNLLLLLNHAVTPDHPAGERLAPEPCYLWRIDSCITQRKAQGPSRDCNESKEEEEEEAVWRADL